MEYSNLSIEELRKLKYEEIEINNRRLVREACIKHQNGLCLHCGKSLTELPDENILNHSITVSLFPPKFFNYPVHLHHDHNSGCVIGAVHAYCNAVLWEYHDE